MTTSANYPWNCADFTAMFGYWRDLHDKVGGMPPWRSFDVLQLRDFISMLQVIGLRDDRLYNRLIPNDITNGTNLRLDQLADFRQWMTPENFHQTLAVVRQASERCCAVRVRARREFSDRPAVGFWGLMLPFSDPEAGSYSFLGCTYLPDWTEDNSLDHLELITHSQYMLIDARGAARKIDAEVA